MKTILLLTTLLATGTVLSAADAKDQVKQAIAKLKSQPNYSWTVKLEMPGSQFEIQPMTGKTEKDGFTVVKQPFNENTGEAVFKGDKACIKVEDAWTLASDLPQPEPGSFSRTAFMGRMLARVKPAADDAAELLSKVKEVKAGNEGLFTADLTEDGAKELLSFGRRAGSQQGPPPPKNAKGTAKFWTKGGVLVKFESHLSGTMTFRDEDRDVERIRTIEVQDVGKTKVDVPAEAKKKLTP